MSQKLPSIVVTSRDGAGRLLGSARSGGVGALISLGSPFETPCDGFEDFPGPKLRLVFDDIERDLPWIGLNSCSWTDMKGLVAFYKKIPASGSVLVHCAAGISRSSASGLGYLVFRLGSEQQAVDVLLENIELACEQGLRPEDDIWPNRRVVWMVDRLLGREGRLIEAYKSRWPRYGDLELPVDDDPALSGVE